MFIRSLIIVVFLCSYVTAQETESVRVPEWIEFQKTQQELVEQHQRILGEMAEVRSGIRQININLLSWQTSMQDAVSNIGKEIHCDISKTKYNPIVEYSVIGLALVGLGYIISLLGAGAKKQDK